MRKKLLSKHIWLIAAGIAASGTSGGVFAQNEDASDPLEEEVVITGTRISAPGTVSSSPIFSIGEAELELSQDVEVERVLRTLPSTIPGDGGNVNNGTAGAATVDLRGLGPERNLVLTNGRRMVPFNFNGEVDTATIPTALIERIDVVTGGASAIYGSDAIAGAVNVVLKKDFQGVEFDSKYSETGEGDGDTVDLSLTLGSNIDGDRGNFAISFNWTDRDQVLLGQRPLGQLGIRTSNGANFEQFLAGQPPTPPIAGCGGPNVVADGGSTTAIPTRFAIVGGGAASAGQFREDGTLSSECSVFNFNPFNFYQTPFERYAATALGNYEVNESLEVYSQFSFTNTTVEQQVAPSGTFGTAFFLPLANPLIGNQARQFMIDAGNTALTSNLLNVAGAPANWIDANNNNTVDAADTLRVQLRRRTVELGPRTERFDSDQFQMILGAKGAIAGDWTYDASFSYGESNRITVRDGYTNLTNIQTALQTTDGVTCGDGPDCVPINLFGGFGTITPDQAAFARSIALQQQTYEQSIATVFVQGPVDFIHLPSADNPLSLVAGLETRDEQGALEPDDCLKLAPASCQGGAGGNLLPVSGGYKVDEFFFEGNLPLVDNVPFAESLVAKFAYRNADYDISGTNDTWSVSLNWSPTDDLLFRVNQQRATRAPNIGELFSPETTGLDNATLDPCSIANVANIDATLRARCISTGMSDAQVGAVQDVVSGQVNVVNGSDPAALPTPEEADTLTAGFVWTPEFGSTTFRLNVDYYEIEINDVIGEFSAQEILDRCYELGIDFECAKVRRIGGDLTISGAGIEQFTTNLDFQTAEGIEVGMNLGFDLQELGDLQFSLNLNKYITQESRSIATSDVIDCNGFFGTTCDPISEFRWVQRTTWNWNDLTLSAQWRHIDSVDREPGEVANTFEAFRSIDSYDYIDLFASYKWNETVTLSIGIDNALDDDPPVVGNEAGDTSSNSGNTFPSNYDTLGRIYTAGINVRF